MQSLQRSNVNSRQDLGAVVGRLESFQAMAETFNSGLRVLIQSELQKRRERVTKDTAVSAAFSVPFGKRARSTQALLHFLSARRSAGDSTKLKRDRRRAMGAREHNYEMILDVLRDLGHSIEHHCQRVRSNDRATSPGQSFSSS